MSSLGTSILYEKLYVKMLLYLHKILIDISLCFLTLMAHQSQEMHQCILFHLITPLLLRVVSPRIYLRENKDFR